MKKLFVLLIALALFASVLCSCGTRKNYTVMGKYDLNTYLDYYWDSEAIYHESYLPLSSKEGEKELEVTLMYKPDSIIAVQNFNATVTYEEGKDYRLSGGKLYITEDSAIVRQPYEYYYHGENDPKKTSSGVLYNFGNGVYSPLFANGEIQSKMILVSYTHSDKWEGPVPASKGSIIPKTLEKLKSGKDVSIVLYGDSIAYGADSSCYYKGVFGENWVPDYFDLAMAKLKEKYPSANIKAVNTAVGGTGIKWAMDNLQGSVLNYSPDLVIVAFGMNDFNYTGKRYKEKIAELLDAIREKYPECEFIVVSTMMYNADIVDTASWHQQDHQKYFGELENDYSGVAFMNMTEIHQYLLTKKLFRDMTGNNINHPNDFLARAYAQTLLKTMSE